MKLTLVLLALGVLSASSAADHKVVWCHFPPGLVGTSISDSPYVVIVIDQSAVPAHSAHQFDHALDGAGSCAGDIG